MPLVLGGLTSMSSCRTSAACLTHRHCARALRLSHSHSLNGSRITVRSSSSSSSGSSGDELEKRPIAEPAILKNLGDVFVLDVRDNDEMDMGGEKLSSSVNVPLNKAKGVNKTLDEFKADLEAAGVWATLEQRGTDAPIITHCGAGGRGGKACDAMTKLGFTNVHNGGGPDDVRAVRPDLS